jgi:hypothetical protein
VVYDVGQWSVVMVDGERLQAEAVIVGGVDVVRVG